MPRFAFELPKTQLGSAFLVVGLGCGEDAPTTREYRDIGAFCLRAADDSGAATLSVRFGDTDTVCLSSCDDNVGSCRATVVGDRIELESTLEVTRGTATTCNAGCAKFTATCALEAPAGDYVFVLQGRTATAALPSPQDFPLFGERSCESLDSPF